MTQPATTRRPVGPPSLDELTARYLADRTAGDAPEAGDVEPHEATSGFRPNASATWDESRAVFRLFGVEPEKLAAPPEWATFSALALPVAAIPLAAGLFPQRVRTVPALASLSPTPESVPGLGGLRSWVRQAIGLNSPTALLTAAGVAAGLGDWDDAAAALAVAEPLCKGPWRAVWENQRAAVLWLRGETAEATMVWGAADSNAPTQINLGMAELFARKPGHGSRSLQEAAERLPNDSGWSHLAALYLSLAKAQN